MKKLSVFRADLAKAMKLNKSTQKEVGKLAGVSQAAICNFLKGRRGLTGDAVYNLWPFVYGYVPSPAKFPDSSA